MKGNVEEVTTFFGLDGGDAAYWLHRNDAFAFVVVDHRLADGVGAIFNLVNVAVVLA
ncbi:hypothetical protein LCD43_25505 (plasmid) [Enterobacter asburiae]|nr:hypothetical protein [Enterobacter asburiae]UOY54100.1 hypothetical protein LCD43_25505 [Enterobacter asburiae]